MGKPSNWAQLSPDERHEQARVLVNSLRGNLIISQALHYAMQVMKQESHPEWSNIQDMEMMREEIFMFPVEVMEPVPVPGASHGSDEEAK